MKRITVALCLFPSLAYADPRFHETLRIEADITTVSGPSVTTQGTTQDAGGLQITQPTITTAEEFGPFQDDRLHVVKTIREDF